ncbi:molybdopterin-dependent oxidoreductase [Desulfitobacterium metallireducens]|uniref:Dehydrogenase n=1 Tax=Desulfitobacterium metallireducens DSM 15288 TaxID=871968 RepID=W0E9B3_9FIRM|nr:molybdopterin-dependent oxidoreductase [Desulfitobacterium metallireducens]AHF05799.1 dehydrogenase [Desulfitobacterium metallireducens DSM 15288]
MTENSTIQTNCRFCGYQCGIIATVKDGRVTKVKPDPSRFPYDGMIMRGCRRWPMITTVMDHPQRINYPLKRVGERGSGQWERISWEQALDEIGEKLQSLKDKFGPEMLATSIGGPHTTFWPLHRFMSLFGSANNMGIGQICWNPGIWVNTLTYGWPIDMELDPENTGCAILWGVNPAESDNSLFWRTVLEFSRTKKPLIVVDPRYTRTAEQATLWLPVRPGTDIVLALGFLHVIVKKKLYNQEFVQKWCHGFDRLAEHLTPYTPSYVEKITGIKAENVIEAAHLFAGNSPATLYSGRGIDQLGVNSLPTHRALAILRAITGNVDVPGTSHLSEMPDFIPELDLELSEPFAATNPKHLGKDKLKLQSYAGYAKVREQTMKHNKRLPMRYLTSAHPNQVWQAMLTGDPYPIRSMIVMASNPLLTQADTQLVHKALKSLDLLVVLELFKTPTAMLADYILPSAGALERPLLETKAGVANIAYGGDQAVEPYYERRPDFYFWKELGIRLGQEKDWPWDTYRDSLEASLSPLGLTWDEFSMTGLYSQENRYFKYEELDPNGFPVGFATVSGKVEVYSELLKEIGDDPLPRSKKLPESSKDFPLLLMSGARFQPYYASSYHQLEKFRTSHPEPIVEMSLDTANRLGLEEGCSVWVETERGKARFITKIVPMCEDTVSVEYGWWYPEMSAAEPELGGLWFSNANVLTSGDFETSDSLVGTWTYNGIPCRVEKTK